MLAPTASASKDQIALFTHGFFLRLVGFFASVHDHSRVLSTPIRSNWFSFRQSKGR